MKATTDDLPTRLIERDTERIVLGCLLKSEKAWAIIGLQLSAVCFSLESHRRLFVLMSIIAGQGKLPDFSGCLYAILETHGEGSPEKFGYPSLSGLMFDGDFTVRNLQDWADRLKHKAAERRSWQLLENARLAIESGDGIEAVCRVRENLRSLEADFQISPSKATLRNSVQAIGIENLLAAPVGVIGLPWEPISRFTNGGPAPTQFWIVGARPSVGKSTVVLQIAMHAAAAGLRVIFMSLEMSVPDLLKRILSAEGEIPHGLLVRGNLERAWRYRVAETLDRVGDYPIDICDNVRSLQAIVSRVASTPDLKLLVVDYLGLVEVSGRYENRNQEVSAISRRLKLLALDLGIPVIAAHQLNRSNETEDKAPRLSNLRDSGSLEQDADTVLLLDAPGKRKGTNESKDALDLIIAKQRNGRQALTIKLRLEGELCRIREIDERPENL